MDNWDGYTDFDPGLYSQLDLTNKHRRGPMPIVFFIALAAYGAAMILFAFKEPPEFLRSFFKVPAIFVFLPDRWVIPAGRIFVGLCCFVLIFWIQSSISSYH